MSLSTPPPHILVINDAQEVLELMKELLEDEGYRVTIHSSAIRDVEQIRAINPDLIVLDHLMGHEEYGWQMVQSIRLNRELATLPLVICTGAAKLVQELQGHLKAKNVTVVLKPFDIDDMLNAISEGLNGTTT